MKAWELAIIDWTKAKLRENELLLRDDWRGMEDEMSERHRAKLAAEIELFRVGMRLMATAEKPKAKTRRKSRLVKP